MNRPVAIGTLEGRLCGHLARALANHLVKAEGSAGPARKGDTFWHSAMTDFEFTHEALEAIGVFPLQKHPDGRTVNAFIVDAEQMPDFLATHDVSDRVSEILEAFVRVACGYGGLPDRGNWFDCPEKWNVAMKYLSLAGYAEQSGIRFPPHFGRDGTLGIVSQRNRRLWPQPASPLSGSDGREAAFRFARSIRGKISLHSWPASRNRSRDENCSVSTAPYCPVSC